MDNATVKYRVERLVKGQWEPVKLGLCAEKTTHGVRIWDPLKEGDGPEFAEWFPFQSLKLRTQEVA